LKNSQWNKHGLHNLERRRVQQRKRANPPQRVSYRYRLPTFDPFDAVAAAKEAARRHEDERVKRDTWSSISNFFRPKIG
jgi:hypothetical protein